MKGWHWLLIDQINVKVMETYIRDTYCYITECVVCLKNLNMLLCHCLWVLSIARLIKLFFVEQLWFLLIEKSQFEKTRKNKFLPGMFVSSLMAK